MNALIRGMTLLALCALVASASSSSSACTGIAIKPKDGSVIVARTLEFASDIQSSIIVVPRGKEYVGSAPGGKPGLRWKSKYGGVGTNGFKYEIFVDGLNEKGLSVGTFYFPGFTSYQKVGPGEEAQSIAPHELPVHLLTTCATVEEAVAAARKVKVGDTVLKEFGFVAPFHFIVHDAGGACVVLEYPDGELKVHKNPLGVLTNSPTFDWHMINLRNHINLSVIDLPPVKLDGKPFAALGMGAGMLGLPGDFTPPSRFVRAVAFTQAAFPVDKAEDGIKQAFHILNQFDIPKGAVREKSDGRVMADYTQWTTAADLKNLRYYFRTFDNSRIRAVDLNKCDLTAKEVRFISMAGKEEFEDVTSKGK